MVAVHISKHSLFRLKITVGCRLCTCPSIHFSLDEDTFKITVGCLVCGVVCVCGVLWWCVCVVCCGGVLWWCVLLCCGGACVWCVVKLDTLSLSCSLSFLFSFPFFFSLIFLFLSSFSFSFSHVPSLVLSLSLLSSFFPSTHSSLLFPSRQQTLYKALINKHGVQL